MRGVSAAFLQAVTGSHIMVSRARVCSPGQTGTSPSGTVIPILGGDVRFDALSDVRGTLDLVTDGTLMWPSKSNLLLAPYGNEIYVERGIMFGEGNTEWVGLGYFRIDEPSQDDAPDGPIRITATDRMQGLIDARLTTPQQFTAGTTVSSIVTTLVQQVFSGAVIDWDYGSTAQVPRSTVCDSDRFRYLDDMITGLGKIWYWDYRGRLQVKDPPSIFSPVWDVSSGKNGVLVNLSRRLSRRGAYNVVVATGEGADTAVPVTAVAYDNDQTSPTYYYGNFGKVPEFITSPFITDAGQAYSAAAAQLRKRVGLPYEIDMTLVPNPALEPWDPVRIRPHDREGLSLHVLSAITIPLTADQAMTANTREQTTLKIGSF